MDKSSYSLEGQTQHIKKLRNELVAFSNTYKTTKSYSLAQNEAITDITNNMRYGIEQYCFYLNMLQDYIQVTIPVDPFVDVLDIVSNEELSEEKQLHLLDLLNSDGSGKRGVFSDYEREWFNDIYKKLDFVIENYSFLQCWESSYQRAISKDLTHIYKDSQNTKIKILKNFEDLKKNTQDENKEVFGDVTEKATAEAFEDKLKNKNKQITTSLIRSNQILKSTVLQTDLNLEEIYIQGNMLTELNDKFDVLDTLLTQSSKIMKIIDKNGSKEKRRVYMSFGFLLMCISWIIWKRLIRGPLKLILWLWFSFFRNVLYTTGVASRKKVVFDQPIFEEVTSLLTEKGLNATETVKSMVSAATASIESKVLNSTLTENVSSVTESLKEVVSSASDIVHSKLLNSTLIEDVTESVKSVVTSATAEIQSQLSNSTSLSSAINSVSSAVKNDTVVSAIVDSAVPKSVETTIETIISETVAVVSASDSTLASTVIPLVNETISKLANSTSE